MPACSDWPSHVDVVGEFRPAAAPGSEAVFVPPAPLTEFLAAGERPIYIGKLLSYVNHR